MIKKTTFGKKSTYQISYTLPTGHRHNPHRPAVEFKSGLSMYYNNSRSHNIVGPSYFVSGEYRPILYCINGKTIYEVQACH